MLNINITGTFEKADRPINIVEPEAKAIHGCILTERGFNVVQVGTSNALENMVTVATLRKIAESIEKKTYEALGADDEKWEDLKELAEIASRCE